MSRLPRPFVFLLMVLITGGHMPMMAHAMPLRLSTWNLDWLTTRPAGDRALPDDVRPRDMADIVRLARYAARLHPDIAALEEVDTPELAARLFPAPDYRILISGDGVVQKTALAVRDGLIVTRHPDVRAIDVYPPDAPRHLRSGLDVTVGDGRASLRVLVIHLKAGCRDGAPDDRRPACRTLYRQVAALTDWIMERQDEGEPFAIMGDFNHMLGPGDAMLAMLGENGPLVAPTVGLASPCWGGNYFIDHIVLGDQARQWLHPDSLRVMTYREHDPTSQSRLSDHCPVSIGLDMP
ncbi:endonuclease/exonuclease/phosphatase family protein [Novacetimonas hansenii]|uniref:endonuclease/exonuclease/phosphatase family protein n=1 Tax=Novacetimonas hansenii TaxID=436 RepID=UPI00248DEE2C|nr:endonuclease/exonuclease/phosphatase family protein [Novacetimonas hansenii]